MSDESKSSAWRIAVLQGLAIAIIFAPVAFVVGLADIVHDEKRFGLGLVCVATVVFGMVTAASYLVQTGRRGAARALSLVGVGLVASVVALFLALPSGSNAPEPLTDEERRPLEEITESGHRIMRQTTLGFSFDHPGDRFQSSSTQELAPFLSELGDPSRIHVWAWHDRLSGEVVVIFLLKGIEHRQEFEDLAGGFVDGMRLQEGGSLFRNDLTWTDERQLAIVEGRMPNSLFMSAFIRHERLGTDNEHFAIILLAATTDRGSLDVVLESFLAR